MMTAIDQPASAPVPSSPTIDARPTGRGRVVLALVGLLALYGVLSLLNDPHGYLGTDTGGKVLTLQAMEERGTGTNLDVGYWAERFDPDGELHPYFGTSPVGDRWIQVTTAPMMLVASPLYDAGGYRLALLAPMLGGVAVAAAARALAARFGADRRQAWLAYWLVGLAGPVLIYSLDLWEHTLGLAAMAWAVVALADARASSSLRRVGLLGFGAGLLWGAGFSMRTESLLYAATTTAAVGLAMVLAERRLARPLVLGGATAVGLVLAVAANRVLEGIAVGGSFRTGRASGTASAAGAQLGTRLEEGLVTTVGLTPGSAPRDLLAGAAAVGLLALVVHAARQPVGSPLRDRLPLLAIVSALPFLLVVRDGLGFVPGLFIASPLAVIGLAAGRTRRTAPFWWAALASLPLVWLFQYLGGAGPQWGARYALLSGFVLAVAGIAALPPLGPVVARTAIGIAIGVTVAGLGWMVVRTHGAADTGRALGDRAEPVLVASRPAGFLPREFVADASGKRWLTVQDDDELERATEVVVEAGFDEFGYLQVGGQAAPERLGDFTLVGVDDLPFLPGAGLQIATYRVG